MRSESTVPHTVLSSATPGARTQDRMEIDNALVICVTSPVSSMADPAINKNWFLHLQSQFERARPILFTGAGFSGSARNICGQPMPSAETLRKMLWELCFPGSSVEDGSSLQDLYENALHRNR